MPQLSMPSSDDAENLERDAENFERRAKQEILANRLSDLLADDPIGTAVSLCDLALAVMAKTYPEKLTAAKKMKILENYPHATEALMRERAMSEQGLAWVTLLATHLMQVALDYSPLSHCAKDIMADEWVPSDAENGLGRHIAQAFEDGESAGMSLFGVTVALILATTVTASQKGLPWPKLIRPLKDAITLAMQRFGTLTITKEDETLMLQALMATLGISSTAAKRYLTAFKKQMGRW